MKVFISWSGRRSHAIAEALHEWIPSVIQAVEPWMSSSDVAAGARWGSDIALQLEEAHVGVICLTPENLASPWILFETGALSKTLEETYVCPYIFDLEPTDLTGPLTQFQAVKAQEQGTRKLMRTINQALEDQALSSTQIARAFEVWWPQLETRLKNIPAPQEVQEQHRSDRELLEEVLELVRGLVRDKGFPERRLGFLTESMLERGILGPGTYLLRVKGNSMIDALIADGDTVLMRQEETARNGEMVAVWLKNEESTTLKRFFLEGDRVRLQPDNPTMDPIYLKPEDVEIQAKVLAVIRSYY